MPKGKPVSEEDLNYIMDNYGKIYTEGIAMKLGRTKGSIRALYSKEMRIREDALYTDEDY